MENINYKIKIASEEDIYNILKECNENFYPLLSDRVDLKEFSKKIFNLSITFEAWKNKELVGLIACYLNNIEEGIGFITTVCIKNSCIQKGISSELLSMCIEFAKKNKFKKIELEVYRDNNKAISLYKKFGFRIEKEKENSFISMRIKL